MDLVQDEDRWWGLMNMGMNFRVPLNAGSFFFFTIAAPLRTVTFVSQS